MQDNQVLFAVMLFQYFGNLGLLLIRLLIENWYKKSQKCTIQ